MAHSPEVIGPNRSLIGTWKARLGKELDVVAEQNEVTVGVRACNDSGSGTGDSDDNDHERRDIAAGK